MKIIITYGTVIALYSTIFVWISFRYPISMLDFLHIKMVFSYFAIRINKNRHIIIVVTFDISIEHRSTININTSIFLISFPDILF